jgi:hypothetical protein
MGVGFSLAGPEMAEPETSGTDASREASFLKTNSESSAAEAPSPSRGESEAEELFEAIATEAAELSSEIVCNRELLWDILDRHEDALRKRWMKKSTTWRKTILSVIWPDMASCHRPDLHYLLKAAHLRKNGLRLGSTVGAFVWPYINMEDLSRERSILYLVHTRGRYAPSVFVYADLETCDLGLRTQTIGLPLELNGYTMLLEGNTVETYGRLMAWGDDDHLRSGFTPGEGLLILKIQQKVLQFLVNWCEKVLDNKADVLATQFPVCPMLDLPTIPWKWPNLEVLNTYAPLLTPQQTSWGGMKVLIDARYRAAQDHLWALKEDPGYFEEFVLQDLEHRLEGVHDSYGNVAPEYDTPQFWDRNLAVILDEAYQAVVIWHVLAKHVQLPMELYDKYVQELDLRYPLPSEYREKIQLLKALLVYSSRYAQTSLEAMLPSSPPIRSLFLRAKANGVDDKWKITVRSDIDVLHDPLLLLHGQMADLKMYLRYGSKDLVDETERLVFNEAEQKKRVTRMVAEQFSELGLFLWLQHETEIYYPWVTKTNDDAATHERIVEQLPIIYSDIYKSSPQTMSLVLNKVGSPHDHKFSYPCDQRYTRENSIALWKAERNLDLFWQEVEKQYETLAGKTLDDHFAHHFSVQFELDRTPEWIEPYKEQEDGNGRKGAKLMFEDTGGNGISSKSECVFKLDQRAFRASKALFYTPSTQDGPQEISWDDFIWFMGAMLFQPYKFYGNMFFFFHAAFALPTILFYEPRADSKVSLRVAMRMGRRLKRIYGWLPEMFVLKGRGRGRGRGRRQEEGEENKQKQR